MGDLVDTRTVGPPNDIDTGRVPDDHDAVNAVAGLTAHVDRSDDAQMALQDGPYRKSHADLSCIRLIAASAIVAGLLLGTAPVALAQVGHLIATAPAAFVPQEPTAATPAAGGLDTEHSSALSDSVDRTVPYRSEAHTVTSLLSWKGTSGALRCSYGLLVDGDYRSCQAA
jgi:hypothetical protein